MRELVGEHKQSTRTQTYVSSTVGDNRICVHLWPCIDEGREIENNNSTLLWPSTVGQCVHDHNKSSVLIGLPSLIHGLREHVLRVVCACLFWGAISCRYCWRGEGAR